MGMFDSVFYKGVEYQTKDTPKQLCDNYAIEGGELWSEEYDAEWVENQDETTLPYLKQTNHHWVRCTDFTGTIRFYTNGTNKTWIEYVATVIRGVVIKIEDVSE